MDLGLNGQRVLVTGGSMGIGLATARIFAQEGCSVVLAARSPERLAEAEAALVAEGAKVSIFAGDLSLAADRERLATTHGEADILVNNAGAIPAGDLFAIDMARWQEAWNL